MSRDMKEKEYDMILPIKKKWFDMILSGEKKEEYREKNKYYYTRFRNIALNKDIPRLWRHTVIPPSDSNAIFKVLFRNGYSSYSPSFVATVKLRLGFGKPEWGAEVGKKYFVLSIIKIEKKEGGNL